MSIYINRPYNIGRLQNPMQFKGTIAVAADFPTLVDVEVGWFYVCTAGVTDNDPTKTNTGQSFLTGDEIVWNGVNWSDLGSVALWVDDLINLKPAIPGRHLDMLGGKYKDTNVSAGVFLGDASNTTIDNSLAGNASILAALNTNTISQYDESDTGHLTWGGAGNYYSLVGSTFTILRPGTGRIKGKLVSWSAPQNLAVTTNKCSFVYIDDTGTIGKVDHDAQTDQDFYDYIMLYEVLYDGTNSLKKKENHSYTENTRLSRYLHNNVGTVIRGTGAIVTRVATGGGGAADDRRIKTVGADVLEDHGLETSLPETNPVTWIVYYTNASGKWVQQSSVSELFAYYNSAGTPVGAIANNRIIYTLYVTKDDLNTSTPQYIAVMDTAQSANLVQANNRITAGTNARATNELTAVEVAQLGYAIVKRIAPASDFIEQLIVEKATFNSKLIGGAVTGDHGLLNGLADDDHTQYSLLAGRATGQTLIGGSAASETLTLQSTSNATRGNINLGSAATSYYDEVNDRLTVGDNLFAESVVINTTIGSRNDGLFIKSRNVSTIENCFQIYRANNTEMLNFLTVGNQTYMSLHDSSGVAKVELNTGGNTVFNGGNVGIGAGAPNYKLEVWGSAEVIAQFDRVAAGHASVVIRNLSAVEGKISYLTTNIFSFSTNARANFLQLTDAGAIITNGATANTGLSIKGTTGNNVLDCYQSNGTRMLELNTSSGHTLMNLYHSAGTKYFSVENLTGTTNRAPGIKGYPNAAGYQMTIWAEGDAGSDSGSVPYLLFRASVNTATVTTRPLMAIQNYTATKLLFNHDARMGINTTSLFAQCSIHQTGAASAIPVMLLNQADASEGFIDFSGTGIDRGALATSTTDSTGSIRIEVNGTVYTVPFYADQ